MKVSSAPRQEWGEPWRRGSGFRWGGGGGRSQLCSPGSPLRLGRQRERGRGGVRSRLGSAPGGNDLKAFKKHICLGPTARNANLVDLELDLDSSTPDLLSI